MLGDLKLEKDRGKEREETTVWEETRGSGGRQTGQVGSR